MGWLLSGIKAFALGVMVSVGVVVGAITLTVLVPLLQWLITEAPVLLAGVIMANRNYLIVKLARMLPSNTTLYTFTGLPGENIAKYYGCHALALRTADHHRMLPCVVFNEAGWYEPKYLQDELNSWWREWINYFLEFVEPLGPVLWFVVYAALVLTCLGFVLVIVLAFGAIYLHKAKRAVERVKVIYDDSRRFYKPATLKDMFKKAKNSFRIQNSANEHRHIASQRNEVEKWAVRKITEVFPTYRDIGGTRKRGPRSKHLCIPDHWPEDKRRNIENNYDNFCTNQGQNCKLRDTIAAALLTHSDYYNDQEALCKMIMGPTFIITHLFHGDSGIMVGSGTEDDPEVTWHKEGGIVHFQPKGSAGYTHPHNLWQDEGECISSGGAFWYTKIGTWHDTTILYAEPLPGRHDINDNRLIRSTDVGKRTEYTHGQFVEHKGAVQYCPLVDDQKHQVLPLGYLKSTATSVSTMPDGENREANVQSSHRSVEDSFHTEQVPP